MVKVKEVQGVAQPQVMSVSTTLWWKLKEVKNEKIKLQK